MLIVGGAKITLSIKRTSSNRRIFPYQREQERIMIMKRRREREGARSAHAED